MRRARSNAEIAAIMQRFWDSAGRDDPAFYTATGHNQRNGHYFDMGKSEATKFTEHFSLPKGNEFSILEIGCGAGRMTQAFSAMYGSVSAVDISPVMLRRAQEALEGCRNVTLNKVVGDGKLPFVDGEFDVVFSYIVLQHIPSKPIQLEYIREANRVLKAGGCAAIQMRRGNPIAFSRSAGVRMLYGIGSKRVNHMAWKGTAVPARHLRSLALNDSHKEVQSSSFSHRWIVIRKPA